MTIVLLIRDRRGEGTGRRGESHVKMKAEIGVILAQAEEGLEPTEAGRGEEGFSRQGFNLHGLADTLIRTLASRTVRKYFFVVLNH